MKYSILLFLSLAVVTTYAQRQGIKGKVEWISGNQMPGPDKPTTNPQGIKREIYIYQATTLAQTSHQDGVFFSHITTPFVKKVSSKKNGAFCVKLPSGEYSVFVKEPRGLFANSFDGQNRIQCVQVKSGEYTSVTLLVNYEASY